MKSKNRRKLAALFALLAGALAFGWQWEQRAIDLELTRSPAPQAETLPSQDESPTAKVSEAVPPSDPITLDAQDLFESSNSEEHDPPLQTAAVSDSDDFSETEQPIVPTTGARAVQEEVSSGRLTQQQLDEVAILIEEGKDLEAHKKLSAWYWNYQHDRPRFQGQLEQLAKSIYLSPQPHYEEPYVIQSGDQLRKIARQYKLSWKYLARLNRVDPRKIRVGQKLKVVQGPFDAVVDLSDFELTIVCSGQYVRRYRVGIGKDGTSPVGKFTVKDKLEDPTYYGPDGVIANDDPENPLGERWIDIGDSFGIHGTIEPDSIGKSESRGCVRMLNEDVEEVYDFLTVGSTVWIRR